MTTEEFVDTVNTLDDVFGIKATVNGRGDILLRVFDEDEDVPLEIAILKRHAINWGILTTSLVDIPTKILKLMVELAESREEDNKYVILNGKPFLLDGNISTRVFVFNEGNLSFAAVSIDEMADFSYTKGELKYWKATLPKNLQESVDLLTVTVSEAKKVLKNDD